MKQSTYFALTIGPIYKTLAYARKTRELWAASYIFSRLMEQIVKSFINDPQFEIIIPQVLVENNHQKTGAGLFPDRFIVRTDWHQKEEKRKKVRNEFYNKINKVKNDFINQVEKYCNLGINDFFLNYLQFYSTELNLPENEDPIKSIFPILDSLEQQPAFNQKYEVNFIKAFLESKDLRNSFLYKEAFADEGKYPFPQVLEISANSLKYASFTNSNNDPKKVFVDIFNKFSNNDEEISLIKELKNEFNSPTLNLNDPIRPGEQFRYFHKYMAVVHADGDDMGKLLRALFEYGGTKAIQSFSGFLMDFGNKAATEIKEYGGVPVYLGGDDMLFFAPVKTVNKNIFWLVEHLDKIFSQRLQENSLVLDSINNWNKGMERDKKRKPVGLPTISYGLAISYYKYPLKEAIEASRSLLFDIAKQIPGKNTISFRLLKHAGHNIGASFNKQWRTWEAFNEFLVDEKLNKDFMSSIQFKLEPLRPIFKRILTGRTIDFATASFQETSIKFLPDEGNREYLLKNLSDKFFNEGGKHDVSRNFIIYVLELLLEVYRDLEDSYSNNTETADKAIDTVYSCLRMMQFYNQPDNKEEE